MPQYDTSVPAGMSRRHFLQHLSTTTMAIPAMHWTQAIQAHAGDIKKAGKSCILLWMSGGPATIDIWDLKPGNENGGEFKAASTAVPGIQISEHMPNVAKQMKNVAIVRSMSTIEADHNRGTYKMHTGYVPATTMQHPSFGAVFAHDLGPGVKDFDLPHFVSIGAPGVGSGFLGMAHAPFVVQNPGSPIQNLQPPGGLSELRMNARLQFLSDMENQFIKDGRGIAATDHRAVYEKTVRMMNSKQLEAFKLDQESADLRKRYGDSNFGRGCLMARRLIETGVTFVEVILGGWDTHNRTFDAHKTRLQPDLDKGMGTLIGDLAERGLLDKTLVVWMGEFGRTPRINQDSGRDHWARSWSVAMAGGGIKGGQVIGRTSADGTVVEDRPLDTPDLVATYCKAMGIPQDRQFTTPNGRPYWVVDKDANAQPIVELIG